MTKQQIWESTFYQQLGRSPTSWADMFSSGSADPEARTAYLQRAVDESAELADKATAAWAERWEAPK